MQKYFVLFILLTNLLVAQSLDALLEEYEESSKKSLATIDEKLGNVTIYSQKDIRLMQYTTLSDLLKEISVSSLNKNRFGVSNLSLPGSKTDVSGFFRVFINNHEVSSNYTMSPTASWMEFPMDIVDYVEIYRGNSSFAVGSEDGIFFIRIYTKKPSKENATELFSYVRDNGSNSQAIAHAQTLKNGWSYLAYASNVTTNDSQTHKNYDINNDGDSSYLYLNVENENTAINAAYSYLDKKSYFGLSLDGVSDDSKYLTNNFFVDVNSYLLEDKSMQIKLSYDYNKFKYKESNDLNPANIPYDGLGVTSAIDMTNLAMTIPEHFSADTIVSKTSAHISKKFTNGDNNLYLGFNYNHKKYTLDNAYSANFLDQRSYYDKFSKFDSEKKYTFFVQDDYKLFDNLLLVLNAKLDKYNRDENLENLKNEHYRAGAIYTATDNIGFKTFYTKTSLVPTFFNFDFAKKGELDLKTQKYNYYYIEGIYADDDFRLSLLYNDVKIEDFIYYTPVGFINIDHTVEAKNLVLDIVYDISRTHTFNINYFTTKLSENFNNSYKGGFVKLTGEYADFEYFSSLVYRNGYSYYAVSTDDSYNFNMGTTYKINDDISISLKAENIFNDSSKSLYKEGFAENSGNFVLDDYDREITLSMKWVF